MEVSQIKELDTHAIIGGGKAQAFGMSDSPEFFTVLSDTLYRDKKLAVVREVICNAWDAHIMVGKLDLPVEITLTEEEMTIKDFGPGIPHDKIGPIYCVYGNSTKVRDDTQTGGFGLGCKAPFAYSDHFSVTNCYAGKRVVYALSRGGEETEGKPSFQAMVSVPSNEAGVVVSIPLASALDVTEFNKLIRRVVYQGGILAKLNDEELPRIDYTEARKTGMAMVTKSHALFPMNGISVLYGTVVYPVTTTDDNVTRAASKLNNLFENEGRLILIAPPNSIGVQPSREGLSYSDRTTATIMDLITDAEKRIQRHQIEVARGVVRKRLEKRYEKDKCNFGGIMTNFGEEILPPITKAIADPKVIAYRAVEQKISRVLSGAALGKVVALEMARMFPNDRRYFRREAYGRQDRGGNYSFNPRGYRRFPQNRYHTSLSRSSRLVMRLATRLGLLNRLCVANYGYYPYSIVKIDHASNQVIVGGKLILSPSQKAAKKYLDGIKENRPYGAELSNNPILVLPGSSPELRAKVIAEAKRLKIKTVELDFPQRRKPAKAAKDFFDLSKVYKDRTAMPEVPTLEDPQVYMRVTGDPLRIRITHERLWRRRETILKLFPRVALAFSTKQEAKLKAKKVPDIAEAIVSEVKKLSHSRDVLYNWLIHGDAMFKNDRYYYSGDGAGVAHKLAKLDTSLAKELLPARVKFSDNVERVKLLLEVLSDACVDDRGRQKKSDADQIEGILTAKARETFPDLVIENEKEGEKRFGYLSLINVHDLNREQIPDVLEIVRLLKRRRARSVKSAVTDEAQKEAA